MSRVEPNRNVYVGHRYVPKVMGEWDKSINYEGLSIVLYKGGSYTSKKRVPVGIDILNEEFWAITGNYNAQVDYYREETERVAKDLLLKSDQNYVDTELNKKSDKTYVDTELNKKSDKTYVDTELDKKSDITYVDTELNKKSDKTYVDTELDKKSDITYVDTELNKKSDKTYVDTELGKKSDITYVDEEVKKIENDINITNGKVYHLENFGGKGDGVTNSFPAFISALNQIKSDGGHGTIKLLNGTYLMQPTQSTEINNKPINISDIKSLYLTANDHNAIFKLGEGLQHSDFIYSENPDQTLIVRNIIFDANAIKNPMHTGKEPNPRTKAQRLFGIYAKNMVFENNTFKDFYGVNLVIANRNNQTVGESKGIFNDNHVTNYGKDYSDSVHDTSAFYTHANTFSVDHHFAICTNNIFSANPNANISNAFSATELGAKNIIATNNIIDGFHCGIITAHQYTTENMLISDNVITNCARGVYPWAYYVTQTTIAIDHCIIKDNSISINSKYWESKAVYSSNTPLSSGKYSHAYTGIGFHPGIARDIMNLEIEGNNITYVINNNAPLVETYSAIMIEQFDLVDDKHDLLYLNFSISNNKIYNSPNTAISVLGKNIKNLLIDNNIIINPLNQKKSAKNVILVRGRELYSDLTNITIKNNLIDLIHSNVGIVIDTLGQVDGLNISNNQWLNETSVNITQQFDFRLENKAKNVFIDEVFTKRYEGLFEDIRNFSELSYCNVHTPEGVYDTNHKITYYVDTPSDLVSRIYHVGDEVVVKNPTAGQYKGYVCIVAGNKGGWYGYGSIVEERIDL